MDHELTTMWLSVDPMSDKYPGISPYAYCAWNPVKLVDPDGEEVVPPDHYIVNVVTGSISSIKSEKNTLCIVGNGMSQLVDFPDGEFALCVDYNSMEGVGSVCSIRASGGTDYDSKMFTMNYCSNECGATLKEQARIDGIRIPEVITSQAQPYSIGLSLTLIADVGISINIGRYYDGIGNSEWMFGLNIGAGFDIGAELSYSNYRLGSSPKDNLGFNCTANLGISYGNGGYNFLSNSWSAGIGIGLPASASMQLGYTW